MAATQASQATSKANWKKLSVHKVTLATGAVVRMRIPNLALLMKNDAVPEQLRGVALKELSGLTKPEVNDAGEIKLPELTEADVNSLYELYEWIVCEALIDPVLTPEELGDYPQEDLELITQIATRERTTDAAGVRLGVDPVSRWEVWRQHHHCADDCEACTGVAQAFSTVEL